MLGGGTIPRLAQVALGSLVVERRFIFARRASVVLPVTEEALRASTWDLRNYQAHAEVSDGAGPGAGAGNGGCGRAGGSNNGDGDKGGAKRRHRCKMS